MLPRSSLAHGLALGLLLWAACAQPSYRVARLSDTWQRVRADGNGVAFHHPGGGTIALDVTCSDADDVPLDVLTRHLLIGIDPRQERSRTTLTVDGRGALRTRIDGQLDGVPVSLDLVVLKKDGCTYDLVLIAPPSLLAQRQPEFARFIGSFTQVARR
jgi:hypothetical protein